MLTKTYAILSTTFIETIRQPIYGVLLFVAIGMLVLNPSIAGFSLEGGGGDDKIMTDVALSTMLLYGLLASVFSATGVITREIESFTVLTVVSKPVSRPIFLIGKFLGVAVAMIVAYYVLSIAFLMTVRHGVMSTNADKFDLPVLWFGFGAIAISLVAASFGNYIYGWHFFSALLGWLVPLATVAFAAALFFDDGFAVKSPLSDFGKLSLDQVLQIVYALVLVFLAVMILTAFAVALATRFSQVITLILCCGVFLLGLLSDYYFGLHTDQGPLYNLAYRALPNFQFFWIGDALTQGVKLDPATMARHVLSVAAYAGIYTLAILSFGVALFQTREVG